MIDTIVIRLHNVETKYPASGFRYSHTEGVGQTLVHVDESTGEVVRSGDLRAVLYHDTGTVVPLTYRNVLHLPSHNYVLSYKYVKANDFIEFEFSVPKYLYATNIFQFIKYFEQDADGMYRYFMGFVVGFLKKYITEAVDLKDVAIRRVDFCYNQFFMSEYDALTYLKEQKEIASKYNRSARNGVQYDTSLFYNVDKYSFKIYHKGTEFSKHDKKELGAKNPTGFAIERLQEIANRVLRYEITFRNSMFGYLWEQKELYKKYMKFYSREGVQWERAMSGDTLSMNDRRGSWNKLYTGVDFEKKVKRFKSNAKTFFLGRHDDETCVSMNYAQFDLDVFRALYEFFWEYVKKYQLSVKMSLFEIQQKVEGLNKERDLIKDAKVRKKFSYNEPSLLLLASLIQYESLDDIKKSGLFAQSTFYRYQKQLKEIGVVSNDRLKDVNPPGLDYREYLSIFGNTHFN